MRHPVGIVSLCFGLAAFLGLSFPPRCFAQSAAEKITLELGSVTVWLGMPQQEALAKFATAGYKVQSAPSADDPTWVLNGDTVYDVRFTAGRLSFADRSWAGKNIDSIEAVIGALTTLAQYGGTPCDVTHDRSVQPSASFDRIFIRCGKRSVLIMKGGFKGAITQKYDAANLADVYERIGD